MTMVQNRLQKQVEPKKQGVVYEVNGTKVELTPETVRNYLVSGDKERVTMQEVVMFINLCRFSQLNPWLKEAYCIKYGNEPATMVVGKEAFEKRAEGHPAYDGDESGIVVVDESGVVSYRKGTLKLPGEEIIGGYAEVWRKDRNHSTRIEVSFEEYAARKKDGTLNSQWAKKPATMIRKVALVQALREAFPTTFGGMYTAEEQGVAEPLFDPNIIDMENVRLEENTTDAPAQAPEQEQPTAAPQNASAALFGNN